jgi:tetratricopeptide (TPR) repeat protein
MMIINEYREAGNFNGACAQTNHLVEYYIRQEKFDTALEKVEGNISQLVTMDREDEYVKLYLFIARVLKAEILMDTNNPEDARKELEKAFEVVPAVIEMWKSGSGTGKDYYERGLKLRNTVEERISDS